jgi:hypothetical protein
MPLSFFRAIKLGELFVEKAAKSSLVQQSNPVSLKGAIYAPFRAAALPFFLVLPFLIAFPASSSYPIDRMLVFLFTPPVLFLLAALVGVIFSSGCSCYSNECAISLYKDTTGALSLVLPTVLFIPLFVHPSLLFELLSSTHCWTIALLVDRLLSFLVENWIILLSVVSGLYVLLFVQLRRLYSAKEARWFNRKLKQNSGSVRLNKLLHSSIFHNGSGKIQQGYRDLLRANGVLWAGFLIIFLELMWLLPSPLDPWGRLFFNVGIAMAFSIPAACRAWPDWEMAFACPFSKIIRKCALVVVSSVFCVVLIMMWKETFAGPEEFIVFLSGHILISASVVSLIQMLHPQIIVSIDSPGGAMMRVPGLDGFILFLLETVFVLVGASWATAVHLFYGATVASWVESGWVVITLINVGGIVFFFITVPLWVCHARIASKRLNAEVL